MTLEALIARVDALLAEAEDKARAGQVDGALARARRARTELVVGEHELLDDVRARVALAIEAYEQARASERSVADTARADARSATARACTRAADVRRGPSSGTKLWRRIAGTLARSFRRIHHVST